MNFGQGRPRSAQSLADRVMKAMGGQRALKNTRYLRFDFVVRDSGREVLRRTHLWDRRTGRCRLEGRRNGRPYVALFNIRTRQGKAWEGYRPAPATDENKAVREACALFDHDAFWLLSGLKLRDSGSHLEMAGESVIGGKSLLNLKLGFDLDAAQGPGDSYWFHVDPAAWRPFAWTYALKGEGGRRAIYLWTQWESVGKLTLPVRFEEIGGERAIVIDRLYVPREVGDNVFDSVSSPMIEKVKLWEAAPAKEQTGVGRE
jgi:hypothetical protein